MRLENLKTHDTNMYNNIFMFVWLPCHITCSSTSDTNSIAGSNIFSYHNIYLLAYAQSNQHNITKRSYNIHQQSSLPHLFLLILLLPCCLFLLLCILLLQSFSQTISRLCVLSNISSIISRVHFVIWCNILFISTKLRCWFLFFLSVDICTLNNLD